MPRRLRTGSRFSAGISSSSRGLRFRADPASRDARTQFYIAYSCYRQGWHRTHRDDPLYREGLKHVDQAIRLAPGSRLVVNDETLQMRSADELRAELEAGLTSATPPI